MKVEPKDYDDPLPGSWSRRDHPKSSYFRESDNYSSRDSRDVRDYRGSRDDFLESRPVLEYEYGRGSPRGRGYPEERELLREDRKRPLDYKEPSFYTKKAPRLDFADLPRFLGPQGGSQLLQEETRRCLSEISQELAIIEQSPEIRVLPHTNRIIKEEVENITSNTNVDWLDVESDKFNIRVYKRVLLPPSRHPNSNVVGKLMGSGGRTLRLICTKYKTSISVCGAGSRKDPKEEEQLLRTGEPQYQHLNFPLHAEVTTVGPPHLAYSRLADVLTIIHLCCTTDEAFEYNGIRFESHGKRRDDDTKYKSFRGEHDDRSRDTRDSHREDREDPRERNGQDEDRHRDYDKERDYRERPREGPSRRGSHRGGRGGGGRGAGFVPRGGRGSRGGFVPRR